MPLPPVPVPPPPRPVVPLVAPPALVLLVVSPAEVLAVAPPAPVLLVPPAPVLPVVAALVVLLVVAAPVVAAPVVPGPVVLLVVAPLVSVFVPVVPPEGPKPPWLLLGSSLPHAPRAVVATLVKVSLRNICRFMASGCIGFGSAFARSVSVRFAMPVH
jgi:hypothetical protein